MAKFTIHSIVFHWVDSAGTPMASAVTVGAVTSVSHPLNTVITSDDSGSIYDQAKYLMSQSPEGSFATKSIQEVLKLTGITGACFSSDGTRPGVEIYGQVVADCKNNPASTANVKYTIPRGLIVPVALGASRSDDASLSFVIHALGDGSNVPFSGEYSAVTLPASSDIIANAYGLGATRIANQLLDEPQSVNVAFNVGIDEKLPAVGSVWPEVTGTRKVQPVLNFTGQDLSVFDAAKIPLLGANALHASSKFQLKKRQNGAGGYVANGTTEHFALTIGGLAVIDDAMSASGDAIGEVSGRVEGSDDGTNAPVLLLFDQAYSDTAA